MVVMIGVHDLAAAVYEQGPFQLYNMLSWADLLSHQESAGGVGGLLRMMRAERRLRGALARLPLRGTMNELGWKGAPWYDDFVDHPDVLDPYWNDFRAAEALKRTTVPTLLVGGWSDFFLNQTMEQYETLQSRDIEVALTVGPWTHLNVDNKISMPQAIAWLDTHVAGRDVPARDVPVQVFVGGSGGWQKHQSWPPNRTTASIWYLRPEGRLDEDAPSDEAESTSFRYDPATPTPSVGGRLMAASGGARDNRDLEARPDVLTFTTDPLASPLEVHGRPSIELRVSSDNDRGDLFVRVCDVDAAGHSINVTEQIIRCNDGVPGDVRAVTIELDPMAHRFDVGHRVRLQVAGGAFPRFARNLGTGDAPGTATALRPVVHTIHFTADRPSTLTLPALN